MKRTHICSTWHEPNILPDWHEVSEYLLENWFQTKLATNMSSPHTSHQSHTNRSSFPKDLVTAPSPLSPPASCPSDASQPAQGWITNRDPILGSLASQLALKGALCGSVNYIPSFIHKQWLSFFPHTLWDPTGDDLQDVRVRTPKVLHPFTTHFTRRKWADDCDVKRPLQSCLWVLIIYAPQLGGPSYQKPY